MVRYSILTSALAVAAFCLALPFAHSEERYHPVSKGYKGIGSETAYNRAVPIGNSAVKLADKGDLEGAIKRTREAIAIYPYDAMWHHNLGNYLEKQGKLDEAKKEQLKAIDYESDMLAAWLSLGLLYEKKRDFSDAERCYRKSVQIDSTSWDAVANLGDILRKQGRFSEAKSWFVKAKGLSFDSWVTKSAQEIGKKWLSEKLTQCDNKVASD